MSYDHISSAVRETRTPTELLNEGDRQALVIRLFERLGVDVTSDAPWDDEAAPEGVLKSNGWELIPGFVAARTCLVFLGGARVIRRFQCGSDLLRVLSDCPAMAFYVCDEDASYLLCSNHHDFVIGWGTASPWVEQLDVK
jgi:hypothetical protein